MDLQSVSDYIEILQRMTLWPEIVDSLALDRLPELFLPDLVWDFGAGTIDSNLAAVRSRIEAHFNPDSCCSQTRHDLSNHKITLDGDSAESKVNVLAAHEGKGPYKGQTQLTWLTYEDKWKRMQGKWYIAHRTYRIQWTDGPDDIVYSTGRDTWAEDDKCAPLKVLVMKMPSLLIAGWQCAIETYKVRNADVTVVSKHGGERPL